MKLVSHPHRINKRAPLDALVVSQLEAILSSERQLQQRYDSLIDAASWKGSEAWAIQVRNLTLQTDRLWRMLDALEGKYVTDPIEKSTLAAA